MKKPTLLRLHRFRIKMLAAVVAVFTVFFLMLILFSSSLLFRAFSYQTHDTSAEVADAIDKCDPGSPMYYFKLSSISSNYNVSFEIISPDGTLSYSSGGSSAQSSAHFVTSGSTTAQYPYMLTTSHPNFTPNKDFEIKNRIGSNIKYFIYTRYLSSGEKLHIYTPVADIETVVGVADKVYSAICVPLLILMSGILCLLVARFTEPLVEMSDITKDMAALNFERKCGNYGKDEIGDLGRSINTLSNSLDAALMDLKDKNLRLEKDIERRFALDNARKSFISNVSHELKTPIAIISGYAEGLCEGISSDPEIIKEYYQIIYDESQKMNSLVVELLELSKLDSDTQIFTPEQFDIGRRINLLLSHLSLQFENSGIDVINLVPEHLSVYGHGDKLEIVLKNYITNAMAHCSGEKQIIVDLEDIGSCYRFKVFNSGSHINDEDMDEIWDSFYRADKSHERSENRFGLGLSIVKSIMTNHRCAYGATNVEGGVEFMFEVAKEQKYYEEIKD